MVTKITSSGIIRNAEKPRVGATSLNRLKSWAFDEIFQGIDLQWESIESEVREEVTAEFESKPSDSTDDLEYEIESRLEGIEPDSDSASILFGDWKKDSEGKYIPDTEGKAGFAAHYTGFCGGTVSVEWSKTTKLCHHTSPCLVMADGSGPCGDLDTPGDSVTAYSLPDNWFDTAEGE